ncbi:MAG TPA: glycosyltransferase family 2 protein [Terriglobales bacterium]|nr:glycosyltransferase family 2 protein [Terriglobales bacterium]
MQTAVSPATEAAPATGTQAGEVTVVIPAFNEQEAIVREVEMVEAALRQTGWQYEIIVVDDGSTDETAARAESTGAQVIRLPRNRGYGAAIKSGVLAARYPWVLITDADGTYPPRFIPRLLELTPHRDMVVGARTGDKVHIPLLRQPAKWFLRRTAEYLAEQPIPDLNSGLRVIRRSLIERFRHFLPTGFSFTTSITLALLCNGYAVEFTPIEYEKRIGKSKIRPAHAFQFLVQILRMITLFNPLRVFLPLGFVPFFAGVAYLVYDLTQWNITDTAVMGVVSGLVIWSIGLLADQNARFNMDRD